MFDPKAMNNIGGSIGRTNLWLYTTTADNRTTVKSNNYFIKAVPFGVRNEDIIICAAADHRFMGCLLYDGINITMEPLAYT